jgi:nucleotide-binding universal stress UspA family protein
MFKNVLIGVDGSPNGRDAIALARQLADPDGKLTLAHVHRGKAAGEAAGEAAQERDSSRELLERERAAASVDAEIVSVIATSAGRGLHEQALEIGADLLVVGSCSRGVLGRVMLGDDTRATIDGAPCTVAVAIHGYADQLAQSAVG